MATSKAYIIPETVITFRASSGTVVFDPINLAANAAARQSAHHDLGILARAPLFAWRAFVQFATTPVVGQQVDVYLKYSDGSHPDNDDGDTDLTVSASDKLRNLHYIGSIIVDEAATDVVMVASGEVVIYHQEVAVVFQNNTLDNLVNTTNLNGFDLIPTPFQGQAT